MKQIFCRNYICIKILFFSVIFTKRNRKFPIFHSKIAEIIKLSIVPLTLNFWHFHSIFMEHQYCKVKDKKEKNNIL